MRYGVWMSEATVAIAYDGSALRDGAMDVRDLAPALLAAGQLIDAANTVLNGDSAHVRVQVKATDTGSFEIHLQVVQSLGEQLVTMLTGPGVTAAATLATIVFGTPIFAGLIAVIRRCRGRKPIRIEKVSDETVRLHLEDEVMEIPMRLLRLYQDLPVRVAAQKLIEDPLKKEGIDTFEVRENKKAFVTVEKTEAAFFAKPEMPEEILLDAVRRSAYSIVSLAFKEDNKWRLNDGSNPISVSMEDIDFLAKVDANQVSFSKGDILICDVRVVQKRTDQGLKTDYTVVKVADHRPGIRQLPLPLEGGAIGSFTNPPVASPPSPTPPGTPAKK